MATRSVIVVGAGVGGLAAAVELAAQGVAVTVLERAATLGGKLRTVSVAGREIDAGPTVFTMRWVFEEIFAAAGTSLDAELRLRPAVTLARHAWRAGERLDLFADIARSADAIGVFAGAAEARGYRAFCARAKAIYQTLEKSFIRAPLPTPLSLVKSAGLRGIGELWRIAPFETMWKAIGENFADPRLRQLFGRYATYCGSSPFLAPATLMLVAHVEQDGVWLIEGGMHRLATALAGTAARLGAGLRTGAEVARILVEGGRAAAVVLTSGERIAADALIVNADAAALAGGTFGGAATAAVPRIDPAGRSLSALTWALSASTSGFPLLRHNVFFSGNYQAEFDDLFKRRRLPTAPTVYVCAQDRGDSDAAAPAGAERLLCLVNAPATGDTGSPPTGQEIAQCQEKTFSRLAACGLAVATRPEATVMTGPRQFETLFPATGGALYGQATHGAMASFRRPGARSRIPGLYLAGGQHPSGGGAADGGAVRAAGGSQRAGGLGFDRPVPQNGYAWWYVDALSADGRFGITVIAFLGSVFSPYYAWSRRRGNGDPLRHCALNVALYGLTKGWAMTERGSAGQGADNLVIGPSALHWDGTSLTIDIRERMVPFGGALRGTVRVHPAAMTGRCFALDTAALHEWSPLAPRAQVEVSLQHPSVRWSGAGYFDRNRGQGPLEASFARWTWSRAEIGARTAILYDVTQQDRTQRSLALLTDAAGRISEFPAPPITALPGTLWRVARETRADGPASVRKTLEDTPFYARSVLDTRVLGARCTAMHESLSLRRFRNPVVQAMLPFRMPRRATAT